MTFSTRRFWCGMSLALCLVGCMLVPSLRSRLIRVAGATAFGTEFDLDAFRYHRKSQVFELQNFKTSRIGAGHEVRLETPRALMRVELTALVDKQLHLTKVLLEDSQVHLKEITPKAQEHEVPLETWASRLHKVLSSVQWDVLRDECQSLVSTDEVARDVDANMRRWSLRSKQILMHASQLARNVKGYTNPLRHSNEIGEQLRQIEELSIEQRELDRMYAGVSATVDQKLSALQTVYQRDRQDFQAKSERQTLQVAALAAEQVAVRWVEYLANEHMDFSFVANAMLADPEQSPGSYNLNVRGVRKQEALINCPSIKLTGTLIAPLHRTKFQAKAAYKLTQGMDYRSHPQSQVSIRSIGPMHTSEMKLSAGEKSAGWSLESTSGAPAIASPVLISEENKLLLDEVPSAGSRPLFKLVGNSNDGKCNGMVQLNLAAFEELCALPCNINADLVARPSMALQPVTTESWVEFDYSHDGRQPSTTRRGALPKEFVERITSILRERVEAQRLPSEATLEREFNRKCDAVRSRALQAAQAGTKSLAQDRAALADVRSNLNEALQQDEAYEYARSLTRPATRR